MTGKGWIPARPAAIEALSGLDTETDMIERLRQVAGIYGSVLGVSRLPPMMQADQEDSIFLVDYELTMDALSASKELKCPLVGFSTLVVWVPRQGKEASWASTGERAASPRLSA